MGTADVLYASNGFSYEVTFESGCTGDGRGYAKRPKPVLSNSGDIQDLEFECDGLSASVLSGVGTVATSTPNKITMASTPTVASGDEISLNGQVRNVVYVNGNNVYVDVAFTTSTISEGTALATSAPVFKHKHSTVSCGATDTPLIKTTSTAGSTFDWATSSTKLLTATGSSFVRARDHVNIGDRVLYKYSTTDNQIRTVDGFTGNGNEITAFSIGEQITNCAGSAASGALTGKSLYKISKGTTEAIECSRRGI